jgi:hypothetical protein
MSGSAIEDVLQMLIVITAGWLVRACRRCSGSAQESRASPWVRRRYVLHEILREDTRNPSAKFSEPRSPDLANSHKHAQKILLKCLWRLITVLYQLRWFHSLHLDSPQYELVQTEYWSRPQNSLPPCSGKWRNLELDSVNEAKRTPTHASFHSCVNKAW